MSSRTTRALSCLLLGVVAFAGCGGGPPASAKSTEVSHARVLTALYFTVASALGKSPDSEAQFKEEIAKRSPDLSVLNVGSVDELFVSDRDGQPLAHGRARPQPSHGGAELRRCASLFARRHHGRPAPRGKGGGL